jgi:sulfotransferase
MEKTYHFLSGLPRSGSTVLASILNQHPDVYVTPTSPMLNIAVKMQEAWREDPTVKANYYEEQINNLTKAILPAFWQHRPESIIIDKGRGWAKNMPNASTLFGKKIKAIVVERDLPSIMASWLTLIKKQKNCYVDKVLLQRGYAITDENRMGEMWFNMVKDCIEGSRQIRKDAPDQIIIIKYDELMGNATATLSRIETFLQLPKFEYDLNNIQNDTTDDDMTAWGFEGLHTIRQKLSKISNDPKEILGSELYNRFAELEKEYIYEDSNNRL